MLGGTITPSDGYTKEGLLPGSSAPPKSVGALAGAPLTTSSVLTAHAPLAHELPLQQSWSALHEVPSAPHVKHIPWAQSLEQHSWGAPHASPLGLQMGFVVVVPDVVPVAVPVVVAVVLLPPAPVDVAFPPAPPAPVVVCVVPPAPVFPPPTLVDAPLPELDAELPPRPPAAYSPLSAGPLAALHAAPTQPSRRIEDDARKESLIMACS
jgi:hypothetical protein